jgi:hypothetical protein
VTTPKAAREAPEPAARERSELGPVQRRAAVGGAPGSQGASLLAPPAYSSVIVTDWMTICSDGGTPLEAAGLSPSALSAAIVVSSPAVT